MSPQRHLLCGCVLSIGLFAVDKEPKESFACLLGSVLSDTDHLLEYAKYCNEYSIKPSFKEFVSGKYFDRKGTVYVIFHAWEIVLFGLLYCIICDPRNISATIKGLMIGYTSHMILDQIGNNMNCRSYFWLFRWWKEWNSELFKRREF